MFTIACCIAVDLGLGLGLGLDLVSGWLVFNVRVYVLLWVGIVTLPLVAPRLECSPTFERICDQRSVALTAQSILTSTYT